uniref:tRNA carboxymethyluridine synthase n=2 Tax=Lotharella globosa TaxID=91324 RepID=A0A6V3IDZ8_9EUKA|mmetsp:Transcript_37669/g.73000  ORF Transcript_37669/g.73000 Transcript_37669/m.73000 type:complete len:630 (+) Transcript_37669:166-2055(+)|eukprot:CAMPEP_0167779202 /NCGR_PEP_ID=MMETSP0111_2-20121227/4681_1 /TAXON_ID=91324 /ORGANISM="Lotharella globosa, Strain CCCM811" /LENGTH=629 /DNA_ID=CAMNT_0007669597 /DNA_START=158 /DNA_END=2047 /DNA_ORIENTATION=-
MCSQGDFKEVIDDIEDISAFDKIFTPDASWMKKEIKTNCVSWLTELLPVDQREKLVPFVYDLATLRMYKDRDDVFEGYKEMRKKHQIMCKKPQMNYVYRILLNKGKIKPNLELEKYMVAKAVRSLSGVLVITVFTSPYPRYGNKIQRFSCKHNCYYCPNEPGLPRSYLSNEPGVRRGKRHGWDPEDQFYARAWTHYLNGHPIDKIEILVLGGTWSEYPRQYQEEFLRDIFWCANVFFDEHPKRAKLSLPEEQKINEKARARIIGLTLETRPDTIDEEEIKRLRYYGCTRVQVGIQHTDDEILKKINRGCYTKDAIKAVRLLKDAGFKIDLHLMPDLPGTTVEKDLKMFDYVLHSPDLQADQWKIYPCQTVPWTMIEKWFKAGTYKPFEPEQLMEVLVKTKAQVHPWIRLNRVIRDIPNEYIMGGNPVTNLRQMVLIRMKELNLRCKCIRCRECKSNRDNVKDAVLKERKYNSSGGLEYFLSFESPDEHIIYGFLRLRLCRPTKPLFAELKDASFVRELHTYGQMRPVGETKQRDPKAKDTQHVGFGKRLMARAEEISREGGFSRIAVIAGIGTREYYRKRGYHLEGTYMVKELPSLVLGLELKSWYIICALIILVASVLLGQTPGVLRS